MSSIREEINRQVKCGLSNIGDDHFVIEPMLLSCGDNACKSCIEDLDGMEIECNHCKTTHKKDDLNRAVKNIAVKLLMKSNFKELNDELDVEVKHVIESMEGIIKKCFNNQFIFIMLLFSFKIKK